jgi:hypothetical protein
MSFSLLAANLIWPQSREFELVKILIFKETYLKSIRVKISSAHDTYIEFILTFLRFDEIFVCRLNVLTTRKLIK